jgi:hypothetical protein
VPTLLITEINEKHKQELESSPEKSEELESSVEKRQNTSNESDSLIELVKELKHYDTQCCTKNSKTQNHPVIGCYQVKSHMRNDQVSYTLSLDDDDERAIMENFKLVEKSVKCEIKETQKKSVSIQSKRCLSKRRTSGGGSGDASSLHVCNSTKDSFSRSHTDLSFTTRSECYEDGQISSIDTESLTESALQIYKNSKVFTDSDTINFTSLSVSRTEISPPKEKSKVKLTNCGTSRTTMKKFARKISKTFHECRFFVQSRPAT